MPNGRLFQKTDDEDRHLKYVVRLKALADRNLNTVQSYGLTTVANVGYAHRFSTASAAGSQEDWQDEKDYLEERLDRLRGGSRTDHENAWWLFTTQSEYSPIRLQDELGWQPTPRGLPSHCDPSLFGWVDAFEDLLAVSSATPMMSLERREKMNRVMVSVGVQKIQGGHWFLFNRMQWQGLNEVYFPVYSPFIRYRSPRSMEEWVTMRRKVPIPCHDWEKAAMDLTQDIYRFGGRDLWRFLAGNPHNEKLPRGEPTYASFSETIEGLIDMMNRGRQSGAQGQRAPPRKPDAPQRLQADEPAQTEEDLYLTLKSNSNDKTSGNPLNLLFTVMGGAAQGKEMNAVHVPIDMNKGAQKTEYKTAHGGSETVFEKVQVTPDGQSRVSIISIEKKDKHGNVTSSEAYASINQPPFTSPFCRKFWENARPDGGSDGNGGKDSK